MLANSISRLNILSSKSHRALSALGKTHLSNSSQSSESNQLKVVQSDSLVKEKQTPAELQPFKVDRAMLYPEQMEWLDERLVRISRPSKNVMQSGTAYMNSWKLEFDSQPRWENWLMGWTSTADPNSNLVMTFPSKEDAIAYCDKNKLQWFVEEQPERKVRRKSYADNFSWNKRTRTSNK